MRETREQKALRIIAEKRITFDRDTRKWSVLGDTADPMDPMPYVVTLSRDGEPDDCSCVNPRTCSHITAARLIQAAFRQQHASEKA